uniref:3-hydroxyanthranilate 3,4-dioxygenase n=1 Tax=Haemonchus contortus TaxID=6289 RepID=A0A7I4YQZ2_HAECO|nr:3-hydroxyanthranilic acid dioxygenase domain containing protein [Haemonchus contortus]
MDAETINIAKWIIENKEDFVPPVCNKCMFSDYLKLFFVGGPNSRRDYHLEEGEEFFYQLAGDMVLKVIERGEPRDITIREGEMFLLPSRVEHSPQRYPNTIGFVVERTRDNTEFDCVRYFVGSSTTRLFERWFHLTDVVRDLPPLIRTFFSSEECRTDTPGPKSFLVNAPYEPVPIDLPKPINLHEFIESHDEASRKGRVLIYGAPMHSTEVYLYGQGKYPLDSMEFELLIWTMEKSLTVLDAYEDGRPLEAMSMTRCPPQTKCFLDVKEGHVITLQMKPFMTNS